MPIKDMKFWGELRGRIRSLLLWEIDSHENIVENTIHESSFERSGTKQWGGSINKTVKVQREKQRT